MPGLLNSNPGLKDKTCWSFTFRGRFHSDSSSSESDGTDGPVDNPSSSTDNNKRVQLSSDAQLMQDLDISSRDEVDTAKFSANPWSIARVNAASRTRLDRAQASEVTIAGPRVSSDASSTQNDNMMMSEAKNLNYAEASVSRNIHVTRTGTLESFFTASKYQTSGRSIKMPKETSLVTLNDTADTPIAPSYQNSSARLDVCASARLPCSDFSNPERIEISNANNSDAIANGILPSLTQRPPLPLSIPTEGSLPSNDAVTRSSLPLSIHQTSAVSFADPDSTQIIDTDPPSLPLWGSPALPGDSPPSVCATSHVSKPARSPEPGILLSSPKSSHSNGIGYSTSQPHHQRS